MKIRPPRFFLPAWMCSPAVSARRPALLLPLRLSVTGGPSGCSALLRASLRVAIAAAGHTGGGCWFGGKGCVCMCRGHRLCASCPQVSRR
jgi:hypothetical protein